MLGLVPGCLPPWARRLPRDSGELLGLVARGTPRSTDRNRDEYIEVFRTTLGPTHVEHVITAEPVDDVIARAGPDDIGPSGADEHVVAVRPDDGGCRAGGGAHGGVRSGQGGCVCEHHH